MADVDTGVKDICKSAVSLIDWATAFSYLSELDAEWGEGGPEWHSWSETYGTFTCFTSTIFSTGDY